VRLTFDGKPINFTADAPSAQGADALTVLARPADASHQYGDLAGHFTIPPLVPSGTVRVDLWGDNGMVGSVWPTNYTGRWTGSFRSVGQRRLVSTETLITRVQNDPIAQSVVFAQPRMISKVDVPMAARATPGAATPPLIVEVRATDRSGRASTPVDEVLQRFTREANDVAAGVGSSNPYVCGDPIICPANEFRALTLRSASNAYRAYVAAVGAPDRSAGGFIQQQQIAAGIFMDSSNNVDWTLQQGWDLRCQVWVAKMSALEARLYYQRVAVANATAFFLTVDQVLPDGTSIEWQYATDGLALGAVGKVWTRFEPFTLTELSATTATIDVRAILRSIDPYVTPAIHRNTGTLLVQSNAVDGTYVSAEKRFSRNVTGVRGAINLATPPGTTQTLYVSSDSGTTWTTVDLGGADLLQAVPVQHGYVRYEWQKGGLPAGARMRLRLEQTTTNRAVRPRATAAFTYAHTYA